MPFTGGNEFKVNQETDLTQTTSSTNIFVNDERPMQSIAVDDFGNIVVTWSSLGQDVPGKAEWGVYARRYDATTGQWSNEFLVNRDTPDPGDLRSGSQLASAVAMDDDGDFIITWTSYSNFQDDQAGYGIYAQRYDKAGTALGDQFRINAVTLSDQTDASVAMDKDGDFVVTWTSRNQDSTGSRGVYARRYDKNGVAKDPADIPVNTYTTNDQLHSSIAMDENGNFVVVWESDGQPGDESWGIYGQRFSADGVKSGAEFRINTFTTSTQKYASVSMDATGNFVVTWTSNRGTLSGAEVYARRYDSSGLALGDEFLVNQTSSGTQRYSNVKMLKTGGFIITWTGVDSGGTGVWARRYGANGQPLAGADGNEFLINQTPSGNQGLSAVGADAKGNFAVSWASSQDGTDDVYNRIFTVTPSANNPPTDIALSSSAIAENVADNSLVGTFSSVDPDGDTVFTYELVTGIGSTDNSAFTIVNNELRIKSSPDFETKPTYSIRVKTTDSGGASFDKALTITINNLNEQPTDILLDTSTVNENVVPGTTVGKLSTLDPDANNTFVYSLVAGTGSTDNGLFAIVNNELRINSSPNFEAKPSYTVRVQSSDQNGLVVQKQLTIGVNNVNEKPTDITISADNVNENVPANSLIGLFSTADPDAGDTFTYAFITGAGDTDNNAFTIANNELRIKNSPDFETKPNYSVRVRATDKAGLTVDKAFTIKINDLNDPPTNSTPTDIGLTPSNVNENVPASTVVGTLSTVDPNAGNTFTYQLISGTGDTDNSAFTIAGNQLRVIASPDFEAKPSYSIRIRTTDQGGLSFDKQLTVTINNVNEVPTNIVLAPDNINENVPAGTLVGQLSTVDSDQNETFTYQLIAGTGSTDNGAFTLSPDGKLTINASPNFELKQSYAIRVKVTDKGGAILEKQLVVNINDLPDLDGSPTDLTLSKSDIDENSPANSVIGTLVTTDNSSGPFTYTLDPDFGDAADFTVNGNQLILKPSPNFEAKSGYNIRVKTTDPDGLSLTKTLAIVVKNVNEPPVDLGLSATTIDENKPANSVVGTFTTTDPDANETFTYTLVAGAGSTDNAAFTIAGGELRLINAPNFEAKPAYAIRVRTTDKNGLFFEKALTINVRNVGEIPTDIALSAVSIDENKPANSVVGTFSTVDPDAGDTFTYSLVAGTGATDNAAFAIAGNQLQIKNAPNFETKPSYAIRVRTTDKDGLFFEKTFIISVKDINETPIDLSLSAASIDENKPANSAVGTFSTIDSDTGETFTYALVAGAGSTDNSTFTIVGNELRINSSPDFETKPSYAIRVKTTDSKGLSIEKTFTINVNNLPETPGSNAPRDLRLSSSQIDENKPANSVVGTLSTVDPDQADTFTYSLVAGTGSTDNAAFTIVGSELRLNGIPDFETKPTYSVRIRTTDRGGLPFEKVFTINVNNLPETPGTTIPRDILLSNSRIDENKPANSAIGTFSTTDPDVGDTFTYTLVAGEGSTDNAAFTIVNNELRLNGIPDFETKPTYSIRVRTRDVGGLTFEKVFTVNVNDLPETPGTTTPRDLLLSNNRIDENKPANSVVGTLSTTDPDVGDVFTYSLADGQGGADNAAFTIVNNELRLKNSPNFEAKSIYSVRIRTTDRGGLFLDKVFTINVNNLPETPGTTIPQDILLSNSVIDENKPANSVIGTFSTVDPDVGDTFTYSLIAGAGSTDNAAFTIVNNELRINSIPDFESKITYTIRVRSTDRGGLFFDKIFTVNVNNLPETPGTTPPRDLLLSNSRIDENKPANSVVGTFSTVDPDVGDTFTYELVAGAGSTDNTAFTIVNNELRINGIPNFEAKPSYSVRVRSKDKGGLTFEKVFTVNVNNLPETPGTTVPQDLLLSNSRIDENKPANSVIGTFSTVDPDTGDTFSYELATGQGSTDNAAFTIVNNELRIKNSPNFEAKPSYSIRVRTKDKGGLAFEKVFTVNVNDLPERPGDTPPTDLLLSKTTIDENAPVNTLVGTLSTLDPDIGDTFTYALAPQFGDNAAFRIAGNELRINSSPDFETKPSYSIRVITTDAGGRTFAKTLTIAVNNQNDPPVLTPSAGNLVYRETAGEVAVDSGISITDIDSPDLESATVRIVGYVSGQDRLSLSPRNGIRADFDAANGVLNLTGKASLANYQAAVRAITYSNNSSNPSTASRTIQFTVRDALSASNIASRAIQITPIDTAPVVTTSSGNLAYTENSGEVAVDAGIVVNDVDSPNLTGATVKLLGYSREQDQLIVTTQNGISSNFDAATGTLTLSGNAPASSYQAVLRSVSYLNTSGNPSTAPRTAEFSVRDSSTPSNVATRAIQVIPVASPPVVTASGGSLSYRENSGKATIDSLLIVEDADSSTLTEATVKLQGYAEGQDILAAAAQNGISSNFDAATGVLTLTGTASVAAYQAALRSVTYTNSSDKPNLARTAQFSVKDGTATSNLAARTIQIIPLNDAPTIKTSANQITFSSGSALIDPKLAVSDVDSATLSEATITIGNYVAGEDNLLFKDQNGITGSFNRATGELKLTGSAPVISYQSALRSVRYANNRAIPTGTPRILSLQVTDGAAASSLATGRVEVQFALTGTVPTVDLNGTGVGVDYSNTFVVSGPPVPIVANDARFTNQNYPVLTSAQVSIANLLDGASEKLSADTAGIGIAATYDAAKGTLNLVGRASLADYLQVLRSIKYENTDPAIDTTTRTVLFTVNNGNSSSEPAQTRVQISRIKLENGTLGADGSLITTPATDLIDASESDDSVISILDNLQQNDRIRGGLGRDTFALLDGTGTATIDIDNPVNQMGGILTGNTTIMGFEVFRLTGFAGTATLLGSDQRDDSLVGGIGNDGVFGKAGNDVLGGNAGNDQLDGGSGSDLLEGGSGDDLYVVDSTSDSVIEGLNQGFDTVQASISFTLGNNAEALVLTRAALVGVGNELDNLMSGNPFRNRLFGEAGNDRLIAGAGKDILDGGNGNDRLEGNQGRDQLTGKKGKDTFVLTNARRNSLDNIRDFRSVDDTIAIVRSGFSRTLRLGKIRANQFQLGTQAEDVNDRFVYNRSSGVLFFDADGLGGIGQVQVARLANKASLSRSDITIVNA